MRPIILLILALLPITAIAEPHEKLAPLSPLVAQRWIGTFPNGKMTDEQQFEWVFGGKFLRNTHQVRNEAGKVVYEGETIYAWDPKGEQIVWWYWNTTGGFITGTLAGRGELWLAEGVNHAVGQTPAVRSELRISQDSWESINYFQREGAWKEQFRMTFRAATR